MFFRITAIFVIAIAFAMSVAQFGFGVAADGGASTWTVVEWAAGLAVVSAILVFGLEHFLNAVAWLTRELSAASDAGATRMRRFRQELPSPLSMAASVGLSALALWSFATAVSQTTAAELMADPATAAKRFVFSIAVFGVAWIAHLALDGQTEATTLNVVEIRDPEPEPVSEPAPEPTPEPAPASIAAE